MLGQPSFESNFVACERIARSKPSRPVRFRSWRAGHVSGKLGRLAARKASTENHRCCFSASHNLRCASREFCFASRRSFSASRNVWSASLGVNVHAFAMRFRSTTVRSGGGVTGVRVIPKDRACSTSTMHFSTVTILWALSIAVFNKSRSWVAAAVAWMVGAAAVAVARRVARAWIGTRASVP